MSYDDIIEVLAAALLEKANEVGCLEVLDGFSQRPDTEIEVSAPISEEMLALPLDKQEWPEECVPILKESGAATLGELVEYLNHCTATGKKLNISEDAATAMFPALITFCYDAADMNGKRFFWEYGKPKSKPNLKKPLRCKNPHCRKLCRMASVLPTICTAGGGLAAISHPAMPHLRCKPCRKRGPY